MSTPLKPPSPESARTLPGPRGPLPAKVAYVMNGFPRLSETFIANEIHQLERLGLQLRLFSVKREAEAMVHPVVARIRAPLQYLPKASPLSGTPLLPWLARNLPTFGPAHLRVALRHPLRWAGALGSAIGLAWRHRSADHRGDVRLKKVFIKEFLRAGQIAAEALQLGDIGHLHGHFCHGVATITWLASRMTGIPYSFTAHAKDIYQPTLNPGRLLERKLSGARFVATCTCANAEVLRARHARPDEVHTVYHGLDTDYFSPMAWPAGAPVAAAPLILSVGRFVEKKGFDQLVEACALLRDKGIAFRCLIVGERGDAQDRLRAQIERLQLTDCVRLQGPVTHDALRDIYGQARVFALPCHVMADGDRDGFPNVLAEAMAMGVPVVSTRISGIPEMIDDGRHGLLVEPRDAPALAEALHCVLVDDALHAQLACDGRQRMVERFDSRRTTVALRDLFMAQLQRRHDAREPMAQGVATAQAKAKADTHEARA
jgi:glycosyltransferase involved in cell wall biosynthesis